MPRHPVPKWARILKHGLFAALPGYVGLRNRACYRHLTRVDATPAFEAALETLSPESVCIDCGANLGVVTRRLADRCGKVYAFEPDPWTAARLAENLAGRDNVTILPKAVGTEAGTVTLYRTTDFDTCPDVASLATSVFARPLSAAEGVEVDSVDFVAFLRGLNRDIAILKMDVEGAEVDILEKLLGDPVRDRIGHIFVETHELQFTQLLARTERLRALTVSLTRPVVNLDWH